MAPNKYHDLFLLGCRSPHPANVHVKHLHALAGELWTFSAPPFQVSKDQGNWRYPVRHSYEVLVDTRAGGQAALPLTTKPPYVPPVFQSSDFLPVGVCWVMRGRKNFSHSNLTSPWKKDTSPFILYNTSSPNRLLTLRLENIGPIHVQHCILSGKPSHDQTS